MARLVRRRARPKRGGEDAAAIAATLERLSRELGDQAAATSTQSRAMNLFAKAKVHRDAFIDVLYQASGEVCDRRAYPGKAPRPVNQMAYFFAVVEDRLGLRAQTASAEPPIAEAERAVWPDI